MEAYFIIMMLCISLVLVSILMTLEIIDKLIIWWDSYYIMLIKQKIKSFLIKIKTPKLKGWREI